MRKSSFVALRGRFYAALAMIAITVKGIFDVFEGGIFYKLLVSICGINLIMWPAWLFAFVWVYFARRYVPPRINIDCDSVQDKIRQHTRSGRIPFDPLVLCNAMTAQIQTPRKVNYPYQLTQIYILGAALANFYVYNLNHEYAEYRNVYRQRRERERPWADIFTYGLDRMFDAVDGDSDRHRLFEITAKICRLVDFFEGVSLPSRFEENPNNVGFYVSKLHQVLFELSIKHGFNLEVCVHEWLDKVEDKDAIQTREIVSYLHVKERNMIRGYDYNPSDTNALRMFEQIKQNTHCLFAAKSRIWSSPDWNPHLTLEENIKASVKALSRFVVTADIEHLDGFAYEIPDESYGSSPEILGATMKRVLTTLSGLDPAHENCMTQNMDRISWQFTFNYQRIFITSFAPCYGVSSPRYAFGSKSVWILLQPEYSFSHHQIPPNQATGGVRQKIRDAFAKAGRPFETPSRKDLMGHIYVKPLDDINDPRLTWWDSKLPGKLPTARLAALHAQTPPSTNTPESTDG